MNPKEILVLDGYRCRARMMEAAFPMDGVSMDELVENADEALYRAKESGRDRYVIWNEEPKRLKIISHETES